MSDKDSSQKKHLAVLMACLLITEAAAVSAYITPTLPKQKKKSWLEKQQARRGWRQMSFTITDEEIRKGDRRHSYPKCSCCGEDILGKVYPGTRDFECWNEAVNPDG